MRIDRIFELGIRKLFNKSFKLQHFERNVLIGNVLIGNVLIACF